MRPHGHARINARHPEATAVCDRCGRFTNLNSLRFQYQWSGVKLQNLRLLVCRGCEDVPQEQLRTIVLPPDPIPVMNPRPEAYDVEVPSFLGTNASSFSVSSSHLVTASSSADLTTTIRVTPYPDIIPGSSYIYFSYSSISS